MNSKTSIDILFRTFDKYPLEKFGLNIFALADAAQNSRFLKELDHLQMKCLLTEVIGEKAKKISPHLIALSNDFSSSEWRWLEKHVAGSSNMTIIITSLSFDSLFQHLRQFLEVKFEGGLEMMLAFWDPVILATLVGHERDQTLYVKGPVFDSTQLMDFLKPLLSWWYWDRLKNFQAIFGKNETIYNLPYLDKDLNFSIEQEDLMVEATFPDNIIYYLKINNEYLIDDFNDYELYRFIINSIPEARNFGLIGTRDILNYICLKLIYKDNFNIDSQLQATLILLKDGVIKMDDVMKKLMGKVSS